MEGDKSPSKSISSQSQYEDSDEDMFMNLAPSTKKAESTSNNEHSKMILAKMKRLIGPSLTSKNINNQNEKSASGPNKLNNKTKKTNKNTILAEESKLQSENQSVPQESRQRSREKKALPKTSQSLKSRLLVKQEKLQDAAILQIQKQNKKQNNQLKSNKSTYKTESSKAQDSFNQLKKLQKFAEMQRHLMLPVEELLVHRKSSEELKQEKREKKRLDRMMEKKLKEYKVGKVKDQASNCVFNGIEDYFM